MIYFTVDRGAVCSGVIFRQAIDDDTLVDLDDEDTDMLDVVLQR